MNINSNPIAPCPAGDKHGTVCYGFKTCMYCHCSSMDKQINFVEIENIKKENELLKLKNEKLRNQIESLKNILLS